MIIGLLKDKEKRVALLPEGIATLVKLNATVLVETGAGEGAFAFDGDYIKAGAAIESRENVIGKSQLLIKINAPENEDVPLFRASQVILAALNPYFNTALVKQLAQANITAFSLDVIPRISRAQAMDILSSQATVAGYKAVLLAASLIPKFFPMLMTAAGTVTPAKVLILGAGVAGLQAVATSRKLGAVVEVFDVRSAVKEEVVGLGAKFVEVEGAVEDKTAGGYAVEQTDEFKQRQAQALHNRAIVADVIICTAQIPGKKAPVLLTKATIEAMKPGAVVVDIAASTGGNCELTQNNETIVHNNVKIIGNSYLAVDMPTDASKMFGKNVINFLKLIITKEGELQLNWDDEIVKGTAVTHGGKVVHERVSEFIGKG